MTTVDLFICVMIIVIIILCAIILNKVNKKEPYCTDISGGFGRQRCVYDGGCTSGWN